MSNARIIRLTKAAGGIYNSQDITADVLIDDVTVEQACDWLENEYEHTDADGYPVYGCRRAHGWCGWGDVYEVVEGEEYFAVTEDEGK